MFGKIFFDRSSMLLVMRGKSTLLGDIRKGDDSAVAEIAELYYDAIGKLARDIDPDAGDDDVQAVVIEVMRLLKRDREKIDDAFIAHFARWVHRVAVFVLANRRRKRRRHSIHPQLDSKIFVEKPGPMSEAILEETREVTRACLAALKREYREVVELVIDERLHSPQIAARLGITAELARYRIRQGFYQLRRRLALLLSLRPKAKS